MSENPAALKLPVKRRPVRIGFIGCGMVAKVGHGPAVLADDRAVAAACADPDAGNRERFAKKTRARAAYADHREMLDRADLDAVVIATPPWLHAGHVEDAAQHGLAILCEKPLAGTLEDCDRIIASRDRHQVMVQAGHSKRFEIGFQRIKEWVAQGELGRVHQMSVYWHYFIPDFTKNPARWLIGKSRDWLGKDLLKEWGAWRMLDPRSGGGDFFDHGPHYIDLARFILGEVMSISAETNNLVPGRLFEDQAVATLRLENGCLVVLEKSNQVIGRPTGFEHGFIYGARGKLRFECEQEYKLRPMKVWRYGLANIPLDRWTPAVRPVGKRRSLYFRQMRHFIDRLTGGETLSKNFPGPWAATAEDARMAVAWTKAAYRSSEQGVKIKRDEL
ncbi:MAG TPA: Gfo/Idh/MocA family oxidoreductase [bacterium]|nr:Gfo/Idh/MocA family oxidoreductase [bacterium]